MKKLSLYIHIPFCNKKKCNYCSFISFCNEPQSIKDAYVDALIKEINIRAKQFGKNYQIPSVYFGGGTPSTLDKGQFTKIMVALKRGFKFLNNTEITIEVNPESVTEEKLEEYKINGVNRISIGAQSLNDRCLKSIGRLHSAKTFKEALKKVKLAGFKNINVDMMIGLPFETKKDAKNMIRYLYKNKVPHISCYSLILEENTKLYEDVKEGKIKVLDEDESVNMYNACYDALKKYGYRRYEVSNFCKPDYECLHNLNYWNLGEYLSFGIAGHSYMNDTRFNNLEDLKSYLNSLERNIVPVMRVEKLSLNERKEEYIMLHLRTSEGLNIKELDEMFSGHLLVDKKKEIDFLTKNGFISIKQDILKVQDNAFYVLNSIISKLI